MNKCSTLLFILLMFSASSAAADDYYTYMETCSSSGRASIFMPTNFDDMKSGDVRPHSESVNGSEVWFEKGANEIFIKGIAYYRVEAFVAPNFDGTSDITQGLMRLSDMVEPGRCRK